MTRQGFIRNNRRIDRGEDLSLRLLENIYDRVAECEFRRLSDPLDRVGQADELLRGKHRPDKLMQRQRRSIAWFSVLKVVEFVSKRSLVLWPDARARTLLLFNNMLRITKSTDTPRVFD